MLVEGLATRLLGALLALIGLLVALCGSGHLRRCNLLLHIFSLLEILELLATGDCRRFRVLLLFRWSTVLLWGHGCESPDRAEGRLGH